ncbi:replication protein A 70 kDa DNA-binding subunit C-like [Vigna unguiculata]|uniref:replication protein A 70 kDa DNA-binding subunit C-like n=1 Tax=Vigna unguiculata TaxID=3917 RepID=UPI001016B934|nr:replication protein A 70 kDa DNA-binding subunit C-like [Vigna unguiculata]
MAKKFDMIKDIDGRRETLKLAVRIVDLWYVESWDSKRSMEMVLMDQKGDVIVAMIKKEDMGVWEEKLKEGESYIMHNFKLLKNRAQYRVCEHPFMLLFIGATSIRPQPIASIPRKLWKFKSIKDIIDGKYCSDLLVDVIGMLDNVEEKGHSKNVVFDLKDLSGAIICCTLWDSYCEKLLSYWRTCSQTSNVAIILTQAKIKPASGPWPVSLTSGSETFEEGSQYSGSSQISHVDRFMYKTVVKSVSKIIIVLEEISCVTVARTLKFNLGNDGWNYLVCNVCTKRTHEVGSFKCLSCDAFNDSPRIRYKLEIQVTDGKKVANFMLWDQDCMNLIGVSAADLRKKMINHGEDDPKCFPEDLDVILGCTWAFKVKLQGKNRPASVMRVSTDVEIIDHVKALLGQEEASFVGECVVSCPSDILPDTSNSSAMVIGKCSNASLLDVPTSSGTSLMCLSSTADDEPDIVFCMTPSKDVSAPIDDVPDIPSSIMEFDFLEDIPLAQLSATKTTKPTKSIKKEKL